MNSCEEINVGVWEMVAKLKFRSPEPQLMLGMAVCVSATPELEAGRDRWAPEITD